MTSLLFPHNRLCRWIALVTLLQFPIWSWAAEKPDRESPLTKVGEYHLKHSRLGAAAAALGGHVYVFGGSAQGAVGYAERFNIRTNKVEQLTVKLLARRFHAVIEHEGRFYLFGGEGHTLPGQPHESAVEIYDPAIDTVSRGAPWPRPRAHMAAVKLGTKVFLIGGSKFLGRNRAQTNNVDVFDFATGTWSIGVPMPTPREAKAAVVGSFILVPGGFRSRGGLPDVEMFVPHENAWKALPPLSRRISAHSVAFLGRHLFLFGDYDDLDLVMAYDLATRKTLRFDPDFRGARHTAAVACEDRIYVIGGNLTTDETSVRDLIQVFALNPDYVAK